MTEVSEVLIVVMKMVEVVVVVIVEEVVGLGGAAFLVCASCPFHVPSV